MGGGSVKVYLEFDSEHVCGSEAKITVSDYKYICFTPKTN